MQHNITLNGFGFRLRPVAIEDAQFILDLRTDEERNSFIHPTPNDLGLQQAWITEYFERSNDYYFILESLVTGRPAGTIGIYNIDREVTSGEWGRWIILPDSAGGLESAYLIYRVAFEILNLQMVYARTAVSNEKVVAFHDSCGLERHALLHHGLTLASGPVDAVEHRMTTDFWRQLRPKLEQKVERLARLISASPR